MEDRYLFLDFDLASTSHKLVTIKKNVLESVISEGRHWRFIVVLGSTGTLLEERQLLWIGEGMQEFFLYDLNLKWLMHRKIHDFLIILARFLITYLKMKSAILLCIFLGNAFCQFEERVHNHDPNSAPRRMWHVHLQSTPLYGNSTEL